MKLFKTGQGSSKVRSASQRMEKVDALIEKGSFQDAIKALRKLIVMDKALNRESISTLKVHHQNILSRCLIIAEETDGTTDNLPQVERLFMERVELQGLYLKATESFSSLKSRRKDAGKDLPTWTKSDFEKNIADIASELKRNEKELTQAVNELFDSLTDPSSETIVYH